MTRLRTSCLCVLAVAMLAIPNTASAASVHVSSAEWRMVTRINRYRAARHLPRLRVDPRLTAAARLTSRNMARNNFFGHVDLWGRTPFQRIAMFHYPSNTFRGENLAAGSPGVEFTFQQWRRSPGHRANLERRQFRAVGISLAYNPRSAYRHYWTTTFGSRVTR